MKTNQLMTRPMGEFKVTQRTSDGFFNATELLKQWNLNTQKTGELKKKDLDDYLIVKSTNEFISTIIERENLKERNSVLITSRGKYNGGTWMYPLLFIDFAMWINPSFKYDVLKFVYDEMIKYRNEAGDAYKQLAIAIQRIVDKSFMPIAMQKIGEAINWIIFNKHEREIRNQFGDEAKQKELYNFEKKITDLINEGFLESFNEVITYLRKQWQKKNNPF